jgi:hypothetical protein
MEHAASNQPGGCRRPPDLLKRCRTSGRRVLIAKVGTLRRGQVLENKAPGHSLIAKEPGIATSGVLRKIGYDGAGMFAAVSRKSGSRN